MLEASLQPYCRGAIVKYTSPLDRATCIEIGYPATHPVLIVSSNYSTPMATVQAFVLSSKLNRYYGYRIFINSRSQQYGDKWSVICCREMMTIRKNYLGEILGFATPALVDKCLKAYAFEIGLTNEMPDYLKDDRMVRDYYEAGRGNVPDYPDPFMIDREFNRDQFYAVGIATHDRMRMPDVNVNQNERVPVRNVPLFTNHLSPADSARVQMTEPYRQQRLFMKSPAEDETMKEDQNDVEPQGDVHAPEEECRSDEPSSDVRETGGSGGPDASGEGVGDGGETQRGDDVEGPGSGAAVGTDERRTDPDDVLQSRDLCLRGEPGQGGYVAPRTDLAWLERKARIEARQMTSIRASADLDRAMAKLSDDDMWRIWICDMTPYAAAKIAGIGTNRGKRLTEYVYNNIYRRKSRIVADVTAHTLNLNDLTPGDKLIFRCFSEDDCHSFNMGLSRYEDFCEEFNIPFDQTYIGQLVKNGVIKTKGLRLGHSLVKNGG